MDKFNICPGLGVAFPAPNATNGKLLPAPPGSPFRIWQPVKRIGLNRLLTAVRQVDAVFHTGAFDAKDQSRMKIQAPGTVRTSAPKRTAKPDSSGGSSFASHIPAESARTGTAVSGTGPIGSVEALLAVQANAQVAGDHHAADIRHAEDLLDRLDAIRVGILTGRMSRKSLEDIVHRLEARRRGAADSRLATLIDEIELRARVELAKLEML